MLKCQKLIENERICIEALHDVGWSLRQIGKDIKVSHSVVKYALESIAETGTHKMHHVSQLNILSNKKREKTTADLQA